MYNKIAIIGVGLIGGSLGLAIKRKYPDAIIKGVSSRSAIADAVEIGAISEGFSYEDIALAVEDVELIILCTPINRIKGLITLLCPLVKKGVLITDVGSTKKVITEHACSILPEGVDFIGGHPMTGSEKRGVGSADPFLFQNAIYVLCPGKDVSPEIVNKFNAFIQSIGASVVILSADVHDRIASSVSHLPQLIAVALVEMVGNLNADEPAHLRLAAGGFRDMTRISSSPFSIWDDIFRTNEIPVKESIDLFIECLQKIKERVGSQELGENFEIANFTRGTIPKDSKGFMKALFEVLVVVEDKPGVISEISGVLFEHSINIKDIEVLKVREGEGGTLRLAFDSENGALSAVDLLNSKGYTARVRN